MVEVAVSLTISGGGAAFAEVQVANATRHQSNIGLRRDLYYMSSTPMTPKTAGMMDLVIEKN
jgi:hypothetical protein